MEFSQSGGLLDLLRNAPDLGQSSRGLRGGVAGLSHALRTGDTSNLLRDLAPIGAGATAAGLAAMAPGIGTAGRLALGGLATPVAMGLSRYALEQQDPGMRDESWKEILANAGGPQISDEANMLAEAVLDPLNIGGGVAGIGAAGALADTMLGGRNANTTLDTVLRGGNVATPPAGITPEAMVAAQQVDIPKTIRANAGGQLDEAQLANLFDTMAAKGMLDETDLARYEQLAVDSGMLGQVPAADTPIPRQPNFQPVQSLGGLESGAATPTRTMDPYLAMNSIEREIDTAGELGQTLRDFHPDQRQILRQVANERLGEMRMAQRGGPTPTQMGSSQNPTQLGTGAANEDTLQMIKAHVMEQKLARQRGIPRERNAVPGDTGMPQRTQAAPEQLPMAEVVDQAPDPMTRQLPGTMPPPSASPHRMLYPRSRGGEVSTANIDAMAGRGMGGLPELPEGVRGVRGYKPSQATDDYLVNQVDKILKYDYSVGGANGAKELMRRAIDGRLPTDPKVIQSLQLMYQRSGNRPDIQHYVGATLRQLAVNVGAKSDAFIDGLEVLQAQPRGMSSLDELRMLQQNPEMAYFERPMYEGPETGGRRIDQDFMGQFNSGQRLPLDEPLDFGNVPQGRLNIGGNQVTDQLALQRELAGQQVPGGNVASQAQDTPIYQFADQTGQTAPEAVAQAQAQAQTQAAPGGNVAAPAAPAAAEQAYQNIFASEDPRWAKSVLEAMVKNQDFLSREETQDLMSFLNRLKDDVKARYKMDPTTQGNLFTEFKDWAKTEDTAGINPYVKQIADELGIKTYDEEMGPAARRAWMQVFDPGYKGSPMHSKNAALPGQKKGKSARNILPRDLAANLVFSDTPGKPLGPKDQVVAMALDYKPAGQQGHALRVFRTSVADVAHEMKEWFSKNQSIVDAMDQGRKRAETLANYFENGVVPDSWIVAADKARVKFIADQSATAKKKLYDKLADVWTYAGIKSSNQNAVQSLADALMVHAAQLTGDKRIINAALAGAKENGVLLADVDATLKATKNAASQAGKAARELFEILNDPGNAPSSVKEGMKDMVPGSAAATPETRGPDVPVTEQAALEAPATPEDLASLEAGLSAAVNAQTGEPMPYDTVRLLVNRMGGDSPGFRNKLNETVATLDKAYDLTELKRAFGLETVSNAAVKTPSVQAAPGGNVARTAEPSLAEKIRAAAERLPPLDKEEIMRFMDRFPEQGYKPGSPEETQVLTSIYSLTIRKMRKNNIPLETPATVASAKTPSGNVASQRLQGTPDRPWVAELGDVIEAMPEGRGYLKGLVGNAYLLPPGSKEETEAVMRIAEETLKRARNSPGVSPARLAKIKSLAGKYGQQTVPYTPIDTSQPLALPDRPPHAAGPRLVPMGGNAQTTGGWEPYLGGMISEPGLKTQVGMGRSVAETVTNAVANQFAKYSKMDDVPLADRLVNSWLEVSTQGIQKPGGGKNKAGLYFKNPKTGINKATARQLEKRINNFIDKTVAAQIEGLKGTPQYEEAWRRVQDQADTARAIILADLRGLDPTYSFGGYKMGEMMAVSGQQPDPVKALEAMFGSQNESVQALIKTDMNRILDGLKNQENIKDMEEGLRMYIDIQRMRKAPDMRHRAGMNTPLGDFAKQVLGAGDGLRTFVPQNTRLS